MWSIFFILLFCQVVCGQTSWEILEADSSQQTNNITRERFKSIAKCVVKISNKELYFNPTVALVQQKYGNDHFLDAMVDALRNNYIPQVILEDLNNIDEKINGTQGNWLVVINFDNCKALAMFDFKMMKKQIKYLILVPDLENNDCRIIFRDIGNNVGNYDVTFIERDSVNLNKVFTFIPKIDGYTCNEIIDELFYINECANGFVEDREIFPIKNPINLNKCPFKVGMATLYPFSVIKDAELLQTFDHINDVKGSDMEIMKIVAEYFNATLDLYYIYRPEESPFGDYDFLKFVINGSLEACAGGLYRIYGDVVGYSGVYARQAVVWMYYAERADRSWQNLVPKISGMYVFILFYFCYSFIRYLICICDGDAVSLTNILLNSWGSLIGATSLHAARSLKQKILNLSYLVLCIYLSAYISIQLYSFLTIRRPPQTFKTNDDLMESGRRPFLKTSTKNFINDEKYLRFANTSGECVSFADCAQQSSVQNGVTLILQGNFLKFQALTAVNDEATILRVTENMLTVYNEMLIRKNSYLVKRFQKVVQRLFETGITGRLFYEAIGISVIAKAERANSNMVTNSYNCQAGCAISFPQLAGVFYVWLFGCGLSCCVFLIEISGKTERKLQ